MTWKIASTVNYAHLLTAKTKSLWTFSTRWSHVIRTSTFSISKLHGAPGVKTMTKRVASMRTIGKISEENHLCTHTSAIFAEIGRLTIS